MVRESQQGLGCASATLTRAFLEQKSPKPRIGSEWSPQELAKQAGGRLETYKPGEKTGPDGLQLAHDLSFPCGFHIYYGVFGEGSSRMYARIPNPTTTEHLEYLGDYAIEARGGDTKISNERIYDFETRIIKIWNWGEDYTVIQTSREAIPLTQ